MDFVNLVKAIPTDTVRALHFLTRLPLPALSYKPFAALALAMPLASLVVGLVLAVWAWGLSAIFLGGVMGAASAGVCAALFLVGQTLLTGAMHDDALSDIADGLGGGLTPARKLEIMKDPRMGAYGVAAMLLSFLLRWSVLSILFALTSSLAEWASLMVVMSVLSRWACMPSMALQSIARSTGLASASGQADILVVLITGLAAILMSVFFFGPLMLVALAPAATLAWYAQRQLGGVTGDIYGAQIMLTEIAIGLLIVLQL